MVEAAAAERAAVSHHRRQPDSVLRLHEQTGRAVVPRPSNSRLNDGGGRGGGRGGGIPRGMWHSIGGGESGFATPDPTDSNIVWSTASGSGSVGGIVVRYDEGRRQMRDV